MLIITRYEHLYNQFQANVSFVPTEKNQEIPGLYNAFRVQRKGILAERNTGLRLGRRSHRRCCVKKDVIKNLEIFTGKHLRESVESATLLKREEHMRKTASEIVKLDILANLLRF